jgi:TonB family protein
MFEILVESSREKQPRRHTGCYLLVTSLIYGVALVTFSVIAIVSFNPTLADRFFLTSKLPPLPLLPSDPGKAQLALRRDALDQTALFRQPERLPDADLRKTDAAVFESRPLVTAGTPPMSGSSLKSNWNTDVTGIPGPPPPMPKPTPKIDPPEPRPQEAGLNKVSEVVLQGMAIKKMNPVYPMVAKHVNAGGSVLVQVTIGEDGRVIDANIVSGHRLLRSAVLDAARQWVFTPTTVGGVPIRVQGILTFNFILK